MIIVYLRSKYDDFLQTAARKTGADDPQGYISLRGTLALQPHLQDGS